jgi:ATP-dependent RNA helicase DeaD
MEKFKVLGLSEQLLKSLKEEGFEAPREIQEKAIPLALAGKDIIGGSETGSGKTLAFGAGIIEKTKEGDGIQALILTPTRELADQVANEMAKFGKYKGLKVVAIYGGVSMNPQIEDLRDADIVVGTPGRILDHLEHRTLNLSDVRFLVLDEADRMLDMGFIEDVERIIKACPSERQTFLFSATISPDIAHIAKRHMKHPVDISAGERVDPSKLHQIYYDVPSNQKFSLLVHLLKHEKGGLVMIFCNTRHNADFVAHNLKKNQIKAVAIHGGLAQNKRSRIMEEFKSSEVYALVCTDVAARGLDIEGISHVYNYDSPKTSKEYIHRIGRTARAGKEGIAITIVSQRDYLNFRNMLEDPDIVIKQVELPKDLERAFMQINISEDRGRFSGRGGFRDRGGREGGGRGFGGRGGGRGFGGRGGGGSSRGGGSSFGGRKYEGRREDKGEGSGRREGGRSFGGRSGGRSFGSRGSGSGRSFGGGGRGRRY